MEITSFNGYSWESLNEVHININYNNKERQTWTKTLNTRVMECYFLSRPVEEEGKPVRGYSRRMHNIWKERYGTEITEHLCDPSRMKKKNECITKPELKSISRKVLQKEKDIEAGLQIIFQNLSDIMSGRNEIPSDIYENLSHINIYKNFIKS